MDTWDSSPRKKEKACPIGKLEGVKDPAAISTGAELDRTERKNTFEYTRHLRI